MSFKVRLEIDSNAEEEIVIRCKSINGEVLRLQSLLSGSAESEMELTLGNAIHFVKISSILFFETDGAKTVAHTKSNMYYSDYKLYELEERLPAGFMRISKSCIINLYAVASIRRDLTGIGEACFADTVKKVYISRGYFKPFKEKLNETRLK
jgi:DNA-binding LytR/AlgR family response regulator